ncbi:MAG TPA: nicotinate-nucleotide adenylyltransferase, partial [Phaeodactylibacter sp.]|nr:nicotinate-nucleotide adenylyltransferase [Phaeodactylibacter sp.]
MSKNKIGLFFGSFNPIHVGHLIIANYMATQTDLKEVWLVVSPQNPLKKKSSLARDFDRLHLVRLAIEDSDYLKASNIEFDLPKPSYTIDTLTYLSEQHPQKDFVLIMGGDNLKTFHKWKNYEQILKHYGIYVYKRPNYDLGELAGHPSIQLFEAPMMQISASYIRKCIQHGQSIQYLVTPPVFEYLASS